MDVPPGMLPLAVRRKYRGRRQQCQLRDRHLLPSSHLQPQPIARHPPAHWSGKWMLLPSDVCVFVGVALELCAAAANARGRCALFTPLFCANPELPCATRHQRRARTLSSQRPSKRCALCMPRTYHAPRCTHSAVCIQRDDAAAQARGAWHMTMLFTFDDATHVHAPRAVPGVRALVCTCADVRMCRRVCLCVFTACVDVTHARRAQHAAQSQDTGERRAAAGLTSNVGGLCSSTHQHTRVPRLKIDAALHAHLTNNAQETT